MGLSSYTKEELAKEIKAREEEEKRLAALDPDIRVAERLHERLCHSNHTDACSWGYESWDKPGHARIRYLKKAKALLKVTNEKTLFEVIELLP